MLAGAGATHASKFDDSHDVDCSREPSMDGADAAASFAASSSCHAGRWDRG